MAQQAKRIAVEIDSWELAAVLRYHSQELVQLSAEMASIQPVHPDSDDLEEATRIAERVRELFVISKGFY